MTTTVYSTDLASYKLYSPKRMQTDVLILHGSFDQPADSDELSADRQYVVKLRINADDFTEAVPGVPASILTEEGAEKIDAFIQQAMASGHDLVVHCHAGESRTGAVLERAFFHYHLPCVHVQRWRSGRKVAENITAVTADNFYQLYKPNKLWHRLLMGEQA